MGRRGIFRVMDLPPEVRNRIWEFAVVCDKPILVLNHESDRLAKDKPPKKLRSGKQIESPKQDHLATATSLLAIAFTCRQLYLEVTPLYYSKNTFNFKRPDCHARCRCHERLADFTRAIGKEKAGSITSVIVTPNQQQARDLSFLPGLRRLEFRTPNLEPMICEQCRAFVEYFHQAHPRAEADGGLSVSWCGMEFGGMFFTSRE